MRLSSLILGVFFVQQFSFSVALADFSAPSLENVVSIKVMLYQTNPDGSRSGGGTNATGYILNLKKGLIVTNLHNITPCMQAAGEKDSWKPSAKQKGTMCGAELDLNFPFKDSVRAIRGAKIVDYGGSDHPLKLHDDWAVLQVNPSLLQGFQQTKIALRDVLPGEKISFVGFPIKPIGTSVGHEAYQSEGQILAKTESKSVWLDLYGRLGLPLEAYQELEQRTNLTYFDNQNVFFHDAPIIAGYSGSAVLDKDGDLIGLIFGAAIIWNFKFGDQPKELQRNPFDLTHPTRKLSTGVLIKAVCEGTTYCR